MRLKDKLYDKRFSSQAILFLAIELTYLFGLFALLNQTEIEMHRQLRSNTIIAKANTVSKLFYDAGIAAVGYSITKNQLLSDRYQKTVMLIPQEVSDLKSAIGNDESERHISESLSQITSSGLGILNEAKSQAEVGHFDFSQTNSRQTYREVRSLAERLSAELAQLTSTEHKNEQESAKVSRNCRLALNILFAVGILLNIALAIMIGRCQRL